MTKPNILIFDEQGFFYGSTQKLMRQMAKILSREFNVFFAYGNGKDDSEAKMLESYGIKIIDNNYDHRLQKEPHTLMGMKPCIAEMIKKYNIHCIYLCVFAHYQFPINSIPASIPLVLISPFGHYSSNGNVVKTYVSGKKNLERLVKRGVKTGEVFFNPMEDFSSQVWQRPNVGEVIIFGRIGRGEDSIFDPISVKAFKKLEELYGKLVKYVVVNAPPAWKQLAQDLQIKNMDFRPPIVRREDLENFYKEIDLLAHARKDGETVGMAIAEAMLSGAPILTHKSHFHNDHFDILDPAYSLWAEADDSEKYFQNMKWMVENKNQIRSMGLLARKKSSEVFGLESQVPKIIQIFKEATSHYYHNSFFGKVKGYAVLYFENFKSLPFLVGKYLTYKFPGLYKRVRRFYYE